MDFQNRDDKKSNPAQDLNQDYGKNQNKEDLNHPMSVQPGYTKYVVDEQKADYDYIKGKFTDDEIKDAFQALDINKNKHITAENLTFFLEYLGEKATEEEIEEMIKMCDLDGNGEVSYDEFYKLATGQSLAPIGQAYAPTPEMQSKREKLEQLMRDENDSFYNSQMQLNKKKMKRQMKDQNNQYYTDNNQSGFPQNTNQSNINQQSIFQQQRLQQQQHQNIINSGMALSQNYQLHSTINNTKINSFYFEQPGTQEQLINQSKLHDYLGSLKQTINQRYKLFKKYVHERKYTADNVRKLVQRYINGELQQEIQTEEEFKKLLGETQDSKILDELYSNLTDVVIAGDDPNNQPLLYTQDLIFMLLGIVNDIKMPEKYDSAFSLFKKDTITKEHLFHMVLVMNFKSGIDHYKLGQKINIKYEQGGYKTYLNQGDIDKKLFDDIINSFPQYF